jgi:hypothetical protein
VDGPPLGCATVCKTIDPNSPNGPPIEAFISIERCQRCAKLPVKSRNLILCALPVLKNPELVFAGVRDFQEGGWCYVGWPEEWCIKKQVVVPFPKDRFVFAVYLEPSMRVYEWRAEKVATDDPLAPEDWQYRYRSLVWKKTF